MRRRVDSQEGDETRLSLICFRVTGQPHVSVFYLFFPGEVTLTSSTLADVSQLCLFCVVLCDNWENVLTPVRSGLLTVTQITRKKSHHIYISAWAKDTGGDSHICTRPHMTWGLKLKQNRGWHQKHGWKNSPRKRAMGVWCGGGSRGGRQGWADEQFFSCVQLGEGVDWGLLPPLTPLCPVRILEFPLGSSLEQTLFRKAKDTTERVKKNALGGMC